MELMGIKVWALGIYKGDTPVLDGCRGYLGAPGKKRTGYRKGGEPCCFRRQSCARLVI